MKTFHHWRTAYRTALAMSLHTGRRHEVKAVQPFGFPFHRMRRWQVREVSA